MRKMRSLIIFCLIATACAQYSYGAGKKNGDVSGSPTNGAGVLSSPLNGGLIKEFFTFVAPEEKIDPRFLQKLMNMVKKSVRVIFIKNPENKAYEDAVLGLLKQASEQKTAIYVLNKQHDLADLANKFNAIRDNTNAKPDVHFVKYRTPEDAVNAQKAIQSQYDSLGGPSRNINGGVAPALNFASTSPQAASAPSGSSIGHAPQASAPSSAVHAPQAAATPSSSAGQSLQTSYLPASILRLFRTIRRA